MDIQPQPSTFRVWFHAARPKTLGAAVAPVMMGGALAMSDNAFHLWSILAALFGALTIQIGTNFANDYYDWKNGADSNRSKGPTRVTQSGLATPQQVQGAFILSFGLASLAGLYLITRGGWPIALVGCFSILSGIAYTGGPKPLGYIGLGDIWVFIFFGLVAVSGTYYVQTLTIKPSVLWAGVGPGLLSTAILTVNNLRDRDTDREAGKMTLAARFGVRFARLEYTFSIAGAYLMVLILCVATGNHYWSLLSIFSALLLLSAFKSVWTSEEGIQLNSALAKTGRALLVYGVLFSIGWVI